MKVWLLSIGVFLMMSISCNAWAGNDAAWTGTDLLQDCETNFGTDKFAQGRCLGEVRGVWTTMLGNNSVCERTVFGSRVFCPADKVVVSQLRTIVIKYLNGNPDKLHQDSGLLIWKAFREAFPCK